MTKYSCPKCFVEIWKWIRIFYNFYTLRWYGLLIYLGRVTHIWVRKIIIIGWDNGLSPGWCQAIISTNHGIFLIGPLETNNSAILIEIPSFSFKKIHLNMLSGKWRPFCIGLNLLTPLLEENEDTFTVYPKKYAHGFCFAVLCCGYTLTGFPISIRLTSLALWQSRLPQCQQSNPDEYG